MNYDKHGNITHIVRLGIDQNGWNYLGPNHTYGVIDDVTLSYNGNQLDNAIDLASSPYYYGSQDFKDRIITDPEPEYHYDANGNLMDDSNKGIVTIRSNWLNLPDTVQMKNGDMASYTYSPSGDKFMCNYSTANTSTVSMPLGSTLSNGRPAGITVVQSNMMLYMDNVVYEGNPWSTTLHNLSKVLTDDGILVRTNSVTEPTPVFERNYYVRDHLGNVRVVFDSQGRVRQLNNYTPLGMELGESAVNQASVGYQDYKFGGKELDRRFELNWYNFGARSYDMALGRWTSPDPLAEKYYSVSPYVYCANNPMKYTDPTGKWVMGEDGKPVTLTDRKWSSNTPRSVKLVGDALMMTEAGMAHLDDMLSPDTHKIRILTDGKTLKSGDEYDTGVTKTRAGEDINGNLVIEESEITIHTGSIAAAIGISAGNNRLKGYSFDEALGIIAGHEKGHTESDNIKQSYENDRKDGKNDCEARPIEIEDEIKGEIDEIKKL